MRNLERAGVSRSDSVKMVGQKTEAIYRRYAIADERSMKEFALKLDQFHASQQEEKKLQSNFKVNVSEGLSRNRRSSKLLKCKRERCGQGQNRTADTRIFSFRSAPDYRYDCALLVSIQAFIGGFSLAIYRFDHIVTYSFGKVVAK